MLMRLDCGHSSDTSSLCHTVCQQQAPGGNDDDGDYDDDDGDGDDYHDDDDDGDGEDRNEKDVIFFSLSRASHSKLDAGPEIL